MFKFCSLVFEKKEEFEKVEFFSYFENYSEFHLINVIFCCFVLNLTLFTNFVQILLVSFREKRRIRKTRIFFVFRKLLRISLSVENAPFADTNIVVEKRRCFYFYCINDISLPNLCILGVRILVNRRFIKKHNIISPLIIFLFDIQYLFI